MEIKYSDTNWDADVIHLEWKSEEEEKKEAISISRYILSPPIRYNRMEKAVNTVNWTHLLERSGYSCDNSNESDFVKMFTQLKAKQTCCHSKRKRLRRPLQLGWFECSEKKKSSIFHISPLITLQYHLPCDKKFPLKWSQCTPFSPTACSKSLCCSQYKNSSWPQFTDCYLAFEISCYFKVKHQYSCFWNDKKKKIHYLSNPNSEPFITWLQRALTQLFHEHKKRKPRPVGRSRPSFFLRAS